MWVSEKIILAKNTKGIGNLLSKNENKIPVEHKKTA